MQVMKTVTLDAHTEWSQMAVISPEGEILIELQVETTPEELRRVVSGIPGPKRVVLEMGPLSAMIHDALDGVAEEVVSCDPTRNALVSRSDGSNDRLDARRLGVLDRAGATHEVYVPPEPYRTLRSLVHYDYMLSVAVTRTKNQLKDALRDVEQFIRSLKLDPVVLYKQPNRGKTVIEKFEKHSDVGFAVVLLTPDDYAYSKKAPKEVEVYREEGVSGYRRERPALERMLVDARAGRFDVAVFPSIDRIARSVKDTIEIEKRLRDCGISVVFVREGIDTATPIGEFFRNVMSSIAEFEGHLMHERMVKGLRAKAAQGGWTGTWLPYGYRAVVRQGRRGQERGEDRPARLPLARGRQVAPLDGTKTQRGGRPDAA